MGHSRKRTGKTGAVRYTAYYDDHRGRRRSAGTFASKKAADAAWRNAEALQDAGHPGDPRAGQLRFASYVAKQWLPNHIMEPTTRQSYRYNLDRHIIPWFGPMKMADILPIHVREWVVDLIANGVTPATIRHQKIILSTVFTTALNDFVIRLHPCRGVKTPTVPVKPCRILTPAEIARLLLALPCDPARLLVDTFIGTGLRWGELIELRPHDLHPASGILTVTRAVVELNPEDHPTGDRFLIKPYPKGKRSRRFRLDPTLITALRDHMKQHQLGPDDLLFHYEAITTAESAPAPLALAVDLGLTDPNPNGRQYRHGTLSAYTAGHCRCRHCRAAFAAYRGQRRVIGLDQPRGIRVGPATDGHLPRNHWRTQIWYPTCDTADPPSATPHARHAPLPRLLAPRRWRRPPNSERTTRPPIHRHHREIPPHPNETSRASSGRLSRSSGRRVSTPLTQAP
jgi:integrase